MGKRWAADLALIAVLLLLMGYSLIGEVIHEWLGIAMLLLLILHHVLNLPWYRGLKRGRCAPYRCVQTVLTVLLLFAVLGSILSGLVLSQYVLDSTLLHRLDALARAIHLPCAYWGFLLMSLHLGFHWGAMMGMARRVTGLRAPSKCRTVILRLLAAAVSCYGLYAFFHNGLSDYLLLRTHFVFFPPDQTAARFLADYGAIMGLFLAVAYYGGILLRRWSGGNTPST